MYCFSSHLLVAYIASKNKKIYILKDAKKSNCTMAIKEVPRQQEKFEMSNDVDEIDVDEEELFEGLESVSD